MKSIYTFARGSYLKLHPTQQHYYDSLVHTKGTTIVDLSEQNLQMQQFHIYNSQESITEFNRPFSSEEMKLHEQIRNSPFYLQHGTPSKRAVASSGKLLSKRELDRRGTDNYGLTRDSDVQEFNNLGFVFFHYFTENNPQNITKRTGDLFLHDDVLREEGYITLVDGLGVYRMHRFGGAATDHGRTTETLTCDGTGKMLYSFTDKTTGKQSSFLTTFAQSHAYGPYIPEFVANTALLKWRHLADEDKQAILDSTNSPEEFATHVNRLTAGIEAKVPGWVKLEGRIAGVSPSYQKAQDELKSHDVRGKYTALEKERAFARQSAEYRSAQYD